MSVRCQPLTAWCDRDPDRGRQTGLPGNRGKLTVPSMSRRCDCYDNAVAESFFSTVEFEFGGEAKWATRTEAEREYIDGSRNLVRRHSMS